jgi:hypothetical protein
MATFAYDGIDGGNMKRNAESIVVDKAITKLMVMPKLLWAAVTNNDRDDK